MLAESKDEPELTPEQAKALRRQNSRERIASNRARYPELANDADSNISRLEQARQREAQRVALILQRDQPPAPPKKGKGKKDVPAQVAVDPTPEWLARYNHVKDSPTTASGFKMAARPVYRKHPWFESLCGRDDAFTDDDLTALRYYRNAFEQSQRSETRCALASMVHGSGGGNGEPSLAVARAKSVLEHLEPALGSLLTTMRAITLEDMTYEQVAMARFGYRYDDFYDSASGTFTQRPRPTSGRNPGKIKAEFVAGAKLLTAAMMGRRVAANANGPAPAETPVEGALVNEQLSAAMAKRRDDGRPVASIIIAQATMDAIRRELGDDEEWAFETMAFCGVPVSIRDDWPWGWVLNDGEVGA